MTTRENDITESFTGDRMSILNEIAARTKERIAEEKFKFPLRTYLTAEFRSGETCRGKNLFSGGIKKAGNVLHL